MWLLLIGLAIFLMIIGRPSMGGKVTGPPIRDTFVVCSFLQQTVVNHRLVGEIGTPTSAEEYHRLLHLLCKDSMSQEAFASMQAARLVHHFNALAPEHHSVVGRPCYGCRTKEYIVAGRVGQWEACEPDIRKWLLHIQGLNEQGEQIPSEQS